MVPSLNIWICIFSFTLSPRTIQHHISSVVVPVYSWGTSTVHEMWQYMAGTEILTIWWNHNLKSSGIRLFLELPVGTSISRWLVWVTFPKGSCYSYSLQRGFQCWARHKSLQTLTDQIWWCWMPASFFWTGNTFSYMCSEKKYKKINSCYYLNQYFLLSLRMVWLMVQNATIDVKFTFW